MTHRHTDADIERERQQAAEQPPATAAGADPAVAQYRIVYRAVRDAPMPPIPAGLATALERVVRHQAQDRAVAGAWSSLLAVPLLLVLLGAMLAPHLDAITGFLPTLSGGPLRTLAAAAFALALLTLHDRQHRRAR